MMRLAAAIAGVGLLLALFVLPLRDAFDWLMYRGWFVDFVAVCRDYDARGGFWGYNNLKTLEGWPTIEFFEAMANHPSNLMEDGSLWPGLRLDGDRVQISMGVHLNLHGDPGKFEDELEGGRYVDVARIAPILLERRINEGRFGPRERERFRVWADVQKRKKRPLKADECGLVEELIIEGGSLSGPLPD